MRENIRKDGFMVLANYKWILVLSMRGNLLRGSFMDKVNYFIPMYAIILFRVAFIKLNGRKGR